jgi:uncharacterized protein YbcV (DUF1398 family)
MDVYTKNVIEDCTTGSDRGRLTFPDVVGKLMSAGVEQYHADLRRGEKTYYLPDGESCVVAAEPLDHQPAADFSPLGIEAALRAVQAQKITYRQFCGQILAAGCVGYVVSLAGRRAVYLGRSGECLVEPFPTAQ